MLTKYLINFHEDLNNLFVVVVVVAFIIVGKCQQSLYCSIESKFYEKNRIFIVKKKKKENLKNKSHTSAWHNSIVVAIKCFLLRKAYMLNIKCYNKASSIFRTSEALNCVVICSLFVSNAMKQVFILLMTCNHSCQIWRFTVILMIFRNKNILLLRFYLFKNVKNMSS